MSAIAQKADESVVGEAVTVKFDVLGRSHVMSLSGAKGFVEGLQAANKTNLIFTEIVLSRATIVGVSGGGMRGPDLSTKASKGPFEAGSFLEIIKGWDQSILYNDWASLISERFSSVIR